MKNTCLILVCFICVACASKSDKPKNAVAKIEDYYLTSDVLKNKLPKTTTVVDSIEATQIAIKNWAKQKLLYKKAQANLENTKKIDELVENYKQELYITHYKNALLNKKLDTVVSEEAIQNFYSKYKNSYVLNETLVKFKYIQVARRNRKRNTIKKLFVSNKLEDKDKLLREYGGYEDYSFNDSTWVSLKSIYSNKVNFPVLVAKDLQTPNRLLTKQGEDRSVYYMYFKEILAKGAIAPLEYVRPTIKSILIRKNKKKFFDQMEQILIDDAVKQNKYEIY